MSTTMFLVQVTLSGLRLATENLALHSYFGKVLHFFSLHNLLLVGFRLLVKPSRVQYLSVCPACILFHCSSFECHICKNTVWISGVWSCEILILRNIVLEKYWFWEILILRNIDFEKYYFREISMWKRFWWKICSHQLFQLCPDCD